MLRGSPPKVLWLRLGNCSTSDIERTLRNGSAAINAFANDAPLAFAHFCKFAFMSKLTRDKLRSHLAIFPLISFYTPPICAIIAPIAATLRPGAHLY
ncbi:MAG: hypothetical protein ABIV47_01240 [Roseiflexaceae bacterium]